MKIDYNKKSAQIVTANKQLIDELLGKNKGNRNIKKTHLNWIARSLAQKEFILTGQGISVSDKGILIDGQHRLIAIRDAGYPPVELLVVTGLNEKSKIYVDQHAKRSVADMLRITLDHAVTNKATAVLAIHMKIVDTKDDGLFLKKERPNLADLLAEMKKYEKYIHLITEASGEHARAGIRCAIFHFGLKYDRDDALEFAEACGSGENLTKADPAYKLRGYILGKLGRRSGGRAGALEDYKHAVACCVAFANKRKMENLRPANSWAGLPK